MVSKGIGITGFPGAGKSVAGVYLAEELEAIHIETGDIVRGGARRYFGKPASDLTSEELGDYSTYRRETDGGDYVVQDIIADLNDHQAYPQRPVVISGVRDTSAPSLLDKYFDDFDLIWVHADFDVRLRRIQERGRQNEGEFEKEDLKIRDGRESMWGVGDVAARADHKITNSWSVARLKEKLFEVVCDE